MTDLEELDIPGGVVDEGEGVEFVRFWIAGNEDHVSLHIGGFDKDHEAGSWGMIAADIVKHAVRGMLQDDPTRDEESIVAEIEAAFYGRLKETVKISGQMRGGVN